MYDVKKELQEATKLAISIKGEPTKYVDISLCSIEDLNKKDTAYDNIIVTSSELEGPLYVFQDYGNDDNYTGDSPFIPIPIQLLIPFYNISVAHYNGQYCFCYRFSKYIIVKSILEDNLPKNIVDVDPKRPTDFGLYTVDWNFDSPTYIWIRINTKEPYLIEGKTPILSVVLEPFKLYGLTCIEDQQDYYVYSNKLIPYEEFT